MATIYAIICDATGKRYIGCTKGKLSKRMREHRCLLNKGTHSSTRMVEEWKDYGEKAFRIIALQSNVPDDVESRRRTERNWLRFYGLEPDYLYNPDSQSFAPTPEAIAKGIEASRKPEVSKRRGETRKRNRKPYCKHGHKFTEENTIINNKGARVCRNCKIASSRKYELKKAMI